VASGCSASTETEGTHPTESGQTARLAYCCGTPRLLRQALVRTGDTEPEGCAQPAVAEHYLPARLSDFEYRTHNLSCSGAVGFGHFERTPCSEERSGNVEENKDGLLQFWNPGSIRSCYHACQVMQHELRHKALRRDADELRLNTALSEAKSLSKSNIPVNRRRTEPRIYDGEEIRCRIHKDLHEHLSHGNHGPNYQRPLSRCCCS
jgi:hypothetical protein